MSDVLLKSALATAGPSSVAAERIACAEGVRDGRLGIGECRREPARTARNADFQAAIDSPRTPNPQPPIPFSSLTPNPQSLTPSTRRGFTLVELLITISIIAIMATMVLFAMFQAQETAKEHKTRALITKLNTIIMRRYDEYRTRRVPIQFQPNELADPKLMSKIRLDCLRDLMRMEMPDRWSDVLDDPITPMNRAVADRIRRPAASQAYLARYNAANSVNTNWPSRDNQGAECLYMIVMESLAQEGDSRDFFKPTDIADIDGDQCPEFVDAWNQPIQFIRWAPGFQSQLQTPIRIQGQIAQVDPHRATVTVTGNDGPRLSQTAGSYVGGTIAMIHNTSKLINTQYMARITGYKYDNSVSPPNVTFTCETPSYTDQQPFEGETTSGYLVVMQPDPFDQRGVYPIYNSGSSSRPTPADTSIPSYAIYPLIFSKGKDRASGIVDDAIGGSMLTMDYTDPSVALNPFYIPTPGSEAFGLTIGSAIRNPSNPEPGWYYGCHLDNITNHQLNTR